MTVTELMKLLETMPHDAVIKVGSGDVFEDIEEVYLAMSDNVILSTP